ncbi:MAG TPA: FkbM family methyltransferase, partial [Solirubrobacteraceae bacterium]|nr:FkbM family methyltransferase [Solirubrobacteraceae bacterium]
LRGQGTYVDVGTNRGQVLREAVRIAPRARHIAFEPIPALAQEIGREFPNVDCRNKAIGARSETAEFCYFHELHGWSGLRRNPEISDARGRPEFITVEVSTLDAELDGVTPSVVKIDVEGAEVAAIEGGRSLLARARPLVIFEHVYAAAALYGAVPGAPWDLLSELAYEIFAITGEGPFARSEFVAGAGTSGGAGIVNWLATPSAGPAPA